MEELGWLTAAEALERLRVRPQTLYAYVSRGRVQSKPRPDDPRRSLYSLPDVERLARSSRSLRRPSSVAASAIAWGEPMLASAISTIEAGRLIYRGGDAVALAASGTLEEVATLLWQVPADAFAVGQPPSRVAASDAMTRALLTLAQLAAGSDTPCNRSAAALAGEMVVIVRSLAVAFAGVAWLPQEPVHRHLARGWQAPEAADAIRRALVLLADHELNVSTFAARVTASTGASLPACVLSGLCALTGPRHGSAAVAVQTLVDEGDHDREGVLRSPDQLPGFGHPLYAGTDVRAVALLASFDEPARHAQLRERITAEHGLSPNIDYALSALAARFRLPPDAPLLLFATARCVGWLAHVLEQVQQGNLIRPRARYIGRPVT